MIFGGGQIDDEVEKKGGGDSWVVQGSVGTRWAEEPQGGGAHGDRRREGEGAVSGAPVIWGGCEGRRKKGGHGAIMSAMIVGAMMMRQWTDLTQTYFKGRCHPREFDRRPGFLGGNALKTPPPPSRRVFSKRFLN